MSKHCSGCNTDKPVAEFYLRIRTKKLKSGEKKITQEYDYLCKICKKTSLKKYVSDNYEIVTAKNQIYRNNNRPAIKIYNANRRKNDLIIINTGSVEDAKKIVIAKLYPFHDSFGIISLISF